MTDIPTDDTNELVLALVREALNNEHPNAGKFGGYDDPEFIETLADHVAYRSGKIDDAPEVRMRDARDLISNLAFQGELEFVTDDMWKDDKVTIP